MSKSKHPHEKPGLSALASLHKPAPKAPPLPAVLPDLPETKQAAPVVVAVASGEPITVLPEVAALMDAQNAPAEAKPEVTGGGTKRRYLVKVSGLHCGRSRFVEARRFLTPWRIQARQFKDAQAAQAWANTLQAAPKQHIRVVVWEDPVLAHANADVGEVLPDGRWVGCPKIAKKQAA